MIKGPGYLGGYRSAFTPVDPRCREPLIQSGGESTNLKIKGCPLFSGGKEKDYLFKNIVKCQDILFIFFFFFFPDRHFVISNRLFRRDEWCGMVAHAESDAKRRPVQQPTDWLLRNNGNVIRKKKRTNDPL